MWVLYDLNKDQLDKLADLLLDLAKAAFILAFLTPTSSAVPLSVIINAVKGMILGLALTYSSLVVLSMKERKNR